MEPITEKIPFMHFGKSGYVVIVFNGHEQALSAQKTFDTDAHEENEVLLYSSDEVVAEIHEKQQSKSLLETIGIGFDSESLDQFLDFAEKGCTFMVVYAPTESESDRVLEVAHSHHAVLVRKYGMLLITDLAT